MGRGGCRADRQAGRVSTPAPRLSALDKIRERLATEHNITLPEDTELHRSRAGRSGLARGQWSWSLWSMTMRDGLGSQWTAADLLRCPSWHVEDASRVNPDRSIYPCDDCQRAESPRRHTKIDA